MTPDRYVRIEEGTYNPETDTYACTDCYIAMGMPTASSVKATTWAISASWLATRSGGQRSRDGASA